MKNNHEAMPNPAAEPEKPEFSEGDIDALVDAFTEGRSEEEKRKSAESIEMLISETLSEIDEKEKAQRVERTGIVFTEAAKAAEETLKDSLAMAMQMADSPEAATLLIKPVHERLQKTLDPAGGFGKLHEDPKVQRLYQVFNEKIQHEAVSAMTAALEKRAEAATDPEEISNLHKLLEAVEKADPGGDKE